MDLILKRMNEYLQLDFTYVFKNRNVYKFQIVMAKNVFFNNCSNSWKLFSDGEGEAINEQLIDNVLAPITGSNLA